MNGLAIFVVVLAVVALIANSSEGLLMENKRDPQRSRTPRILLQWIGPTVGGTVILLFALTFVLSTLS